MNITALHPIPATGPDALVAVYDTDEGRTFAAVFAWAIVTLDNGDSDLIPAVLHPRDDLSFVGLPTLAPAAQEGYLGVMYVEDLASLPSDEDAMDSEEAFAEDEDDEDDFVEAEIVRPRRWNEGAVRDEDDDADEDEYPGQRARR